MNIEGFTDIAQFINAHEKGSKEILLLKSNQELLKFKFSPRSARKYQILEIYNLNDLPIAFKNNKNLNDNLSHYINNRVIQPNRTNLTEILNILQLDSFEPLNLLLASYGISLNDSYWLKEANDTTTFNQINLYTSNHNQSISNLFITGSNCTTSSLKPSTSQQEHIITPELTTDGMLAKGWIKQGDKFSLLKRASTFGERENLEPLVETLASKIARELSLPHVPYTYTTHLNNLCSKCEAFTSPEISYIPFSTFKYSSNTHIEIMPDIFSLLMNTNLIDNKYKPIILKQFQQMLIFDYIIENRDRHLKNFGFLLDTDSNIITSLSPIFDNGMSLFFNFSISQLESVDPNIYESAMSMIKGYNNNNYIPLCDKSIIQNILTKLHNLNNNYDFLDEIYSDIENYFKLRNEEDYQYHADLYYSKVTALLKVRECRLEEYL